MKPCLDCDATGSTLSEEWEGDGMRTILVTCEACAGVGDVTACSRCDEPLPVPVAERDAWMCGGCRAELEKGDASAEMARIARVA